MATTSVRNRTLLAASTRILHESAGCESLADVARKGLAVVLERTDSPCGLVAEADAADVALAVVSSCARCASGEPCGPRGGAAGEPGGPLGDDLAAPGAIRTLCREVIRCRRPRIVTHGSAATACFCPHRRGGRCPAAPQLAVPLAAGRWTAGALVLCGRRPGYTARHRSEVEALSVALAHALALRKAASACGAAEERVRVLASDLVAAEERERERIAATLHDDVGQSLTLAKLRLDALRAAPEAAELAEALADIGTTLERVFRVTRSLTAEIGSPVVGQLDLEGALAWLVERFGRRHGIDMSLVDAGKAEPEPVPRHIRACFFEAVRELLHNVSKHAQARVVKVAVRRTPRDLRVIVEDDGVGFDASGGQTDAFGGPGFGLPAIRRKLARVGGRLEMTSAPGQGTRAVLTVPSEAMAGDDASRGPCGVSHPACPYLWTDDTRAGRRRPA